MLAHSLIQFLMLGLFVHSLSVRFPTLKDVNTIMKKICYFHCFFKVYFKDVYYKVFSISIFFSQSHLHGIRYLKCIFISSPSSF